MGWQERLSMSELKRLQMARAFVFDPDVMVLHRPVDELDPALGDQILRMLREFVDKKGVQADPATFNIRRPRTVFFSGGNLNKGCKIADITWRVGEREGIIAERGSHQ